MNFWGIINLMSSTTIFTSARIAIFVFLACLFIYLFFYQSSYCNFVVIVAFL